MTGWKIKLGRNVIKKSNNIPDKPKKRTSYEFCQEKFNPIKNS